MKKGMGVLSLVVGCAFSAWAAFRPSAVPLVTVDPFFSVWSQADKLTDTDTTHWSGAKQPMSGLLAIDRTVFRLMGAQPSTLPALPQTGTEITPLQTVCTFENDALSASLTFSTPMMPDNLDVFSRPVTYLTFRAQAKDNKPHSFAFTFSMDGAMVRDNDKDSVKAEVMQLPGLAACRVGRTEQHPLCRSGDRVRCDWGYAWIAAPDGNASAADGHIELRLTSENSSAMEKHLLLAYDDIESVMFFHQPLKAWWARNGKPFTTMLAEAEKDYVGFIAKMAAFDKELVADLTNVGGAKYAQLASLAYRHSFAACKLVADANGQPLYFSKEQTSNGCMGTVDVFYPQSPLLALMSPTLLRATLAPIFLFAQSSAWPYPFAPHDIGQYPLGNRQAYGWNGKENRFNDGSQMPVEESGNMLICLGMLSDFEKNADFAGNWWGTVTQWAEFLAAKGFDPENQLCTDDFAGHLAHNANLSIKAIMGLACYAKMAKMRGEDAIAEKYFSIAKGMVPKWMETAKGGAEGGYKLAFDQNGSWSMKYNLVWDRILGFNLFPQEVAKAEMAAYRKLQNPYGLPLDNRKTYTKGDRLVWTATLTQNRDDFVALVDRYYKFIDETPDRKPLSDWYYTDTAKIQGFTARPVIGGVFIPLLYHRDIWTKYASRSAAVTQLYAPLQSTSLTQEEPFTIATFNIRCVGDKGENLWSNRLPRVQKVIKDRGFDLIGFQEVTPPQFADLKAVMTGWAWAGRGREADDSGEGMYIFFQTNRFERLADGTFQLSKTPEVHGSKSWGTACPRTCTWVKLSDRLTGQAFFHFNTHLDHISEAARRNGMALILRRMKDLAQGTAVFLTGDMNTAESDEPDAIYMAKQVLCDTKRVTQTPHTGNELTFTGYRKASILIDFVFTTASTRVFAHATCDDMPDGKFPSDHFPVCATVTLPAYSSAQSVYSPIDLLQRIREGKMDANVVPVGGKIISPVAENFTFDGDILHILGKGIGYLVTKQGYRNYRLVAEYRWGEKQWGNQKGKAFDNGILFHCNGPLGACGGTWPASFESNIIEGGMGDILALSCKAKDGSVWKYQMTAQIAKDRDGETRWTPGAPCSTMHSGRLNWEKRSEDWANVIHTHGNDDPDAPFSQWNKMEVICRGDSVVVFVNGRKVNEAFNLIPSSGAVAVQTEGMETFYRKLELLPL